MPDFAEFTDAELWDYIVDENNLGIDRQQALNEWDLRGAGETYGFSPYASGGTGGQPIRPPF